MDTDVRVVLFESGVSLIGCWDADTGFLVEALQVIASLDGNVGIVPLFFPINKIPRNIDLSNRSMLIFEPADQRLVKKYEELAVELRSGIITPKSKIL